MMHKHADNAMNRQADLDDELLSIIFSEKDMPARCRMLKMLISHAQQFMRQNKYSNEAKIALQALDRYQHN